MQNRRFLKFRRFEKRLWEPPSSEDNFFLLVWTVGLTAETKLRFQIFPA